METSNSIKCRKCGGPHLTMKCGKEVIDTRDYNNKDTKDYNNKDTKDTRDYNNKYTKEIKLESTEQKLEPSLSNKIVDNKVNIINYSKLINEQKQKQDINEQKQDINEQKQKQEHDINEQKQDSSQNLREEIKVRIANLPVDMTKGELYSLLEEWGHIKSLFIKQNYDSTSAFVEFSNSEQSKYFVEALNETPFEYRMITVEIMTN
jgi:RNA recognition motif-containing protein